MSYNPEAEAAEKKANKGGQKVEKETHVCPELKMRWVKDKTKLLRTRPFSLKTEDDVETLCYCLLQGFRPHRDGQILMKEQEGLLVSGCTAPNEGSLLETEETDGTQL
jgi:hypothetical protein